MHFAPYKNTVALYYGAQRLSPFTLRRIVFVGGRNTAPTARMEVSVRVTVVGDIVHFDGRRSSDADDDPLSFVWDFGDGSTGAGRETSHVYNERGTYTVLLTVRDGKGGQNVDTAVLTIGVPPHAEIITPSEGTEFSVGEQFMAGGLAVDSNGNIIPPRAMTWEVRKHHSTHWHPFLAPTNGQQVELLPAPSPEDLLAATNSHLEIRLTATDSDGLSTTVSRIIQPRKVWVDLETTPPGVDLLVDDFRIKTPHRVLSWDQHALKLAAPGDDTHTFLSWSDGGDQDHTAVVRQNRKDEAMKYVAHFHSLSYWERVLDFLTFMTAGQQEKKESTHLRTVPES